MALSCFKYAGGNTLLITNTDYIINICRVEATQLIKFKFTNIFTKTKKKRKC